MQPRERRAARPADRLAEVNVNRLVTSPYRRALETATIVGNALGLAITGFIRSLEGSSAVLNVIVLPTAFLSGSFGETQHYPKVLRAIGDVLPLKYLLDLI